jgi:putative membrane protein
VGIIAWLLLGRTTTPSEHGLDVSYLPAVNASLNALSAAFLSFGWLSVRRGRVHVHNKAMIAAFAASSLFLVSYLTYHYVHGDTKYPGEGIDRTIYLLVLASHVVLSIPVVPLALFAFWFAFQKQFARHKRITRILAPVWLYVSVTGVLVFALLRAKLAYG